MSSDEVLENIKDINNKYDVYGDIFDEDNLFFLNRRMLYFY